MKIAGIFFIVLGAASLFFTGGAMNGMDTETLAGSMPMLMNDSHSFVPPIISGMSILAGVIALVDGREQGMA